MRTSTTTTAPDSRAGAPARAGIAALLALAVLGVTAPAGPASAAPPAAARTAAPAADFGYLGRVSSTFLVLDRAVLLTGRAAAVERARRGLDRTPDFYVKNDNRRLRTLPVAPGVRVLGSQQLTGTPRHTRVTLTRLQSFLTSRPKGRTGPPFRLTLDARGRVVQIAETYLP